MSERPALILVDDDGDLLSALRDALDLDGFGVQTFSRADAALERIGRDFDGAIISDISMPGLDGLGLMRAVLAIDPTLPVILMTGVGDVPLAVEAMRDGAYDLLEKPFQPSRLSEIARRAVEKRRLVLENRVLRERVSASDGLEARLVGSHPAIRRLRTELAAIADTDVDVLVTGETGAGKEVVARALHDFSPRKAANFVAINCAALPKDIFEAELFGHAAGAFTGAAKARTGRLEHAHGGTVFLDEIESMPLDLQAKLLRAIEQRVIEPLGTNRQVPLDVRFVAASKADLKATSDEGRFRGDLFYRLNVVSLDLPPLRARKSDIPVLFAHLAREARARYRRDIPELTPQLEAALLAHDWPGNVRELRNAADRFVLGLWRGEGLSSTAFEGEDEVAEDRALKDRMAHHEKALIAAELKRHGGRMKPTYEALGLSRKGLYDKVRKYGLDVVDE